MSFLGETILKALVSAQQTASDQDRPTDFETEYEQYIRWQFKSSEKLFRKFPNFEIKGKTVLDIGCGTGGRTAYLATAGATRVLGIDVNREEIDSAKRLCPRLSPVVSERVQFLHSSESSRLDIGQFDLVVLVDCMEHVVSPPQMMQLAYDYTAPGGQCFFSCIGYYHRNGSHMGLIPFANVFFSDETILNVVRWNVNRPDYVAKRFDSDPPIERWRGIYDLRDRPGEHLNKLTLRKIKNLVRYSIFPFTKMTIVGFGEQHRMLRFTDFLRHVPGIQEFYHSYVIVEARR